MNNSSTQSTARRKIAAQIPVLVAAAIAAGTLALAGCDVKNAEEAGRKIDQAAANAGKQAEQVGQKIEKKADEAGAALREAGKDVKGTASEVAADARDAVASTANSAGKAADKTGQIAQDASITASIKVDLAKDPRLSALTISVDTHGGEVILRGDVKSQADKERAGSIARNIVGVTKVTNDLKVVG
jgi:hyperosmotically inducible periplasmic protein